MIKLLVFDFDGTLVDTKNMLLNVVEKNLEEFDYKEDKKFIHEFGDRPLKLALERLGVDGEVAPFLTEKIDIDVLEHVKKVKPNRGLNALEGVKMHKIILSNTFREFIEISLKKLKAEYFEEIYGSEIPGDKFSKFTKILREKKLTPKEVLYVGDRVIDVHLARKVGCRVISIVNDASWSSKSELISAKPDFMVESLSEIKEIVKKLNN